MKSIKSHKVAAVLATAAVAGAGAVALPATGNADVVAQAAGKKAKAKLYDNYFDPAEMKVKKGTKMTWKDLGATSHNVILQKGPKGIDKKDFKSGTLGYGSTFKATFKKKGTYQFHCSFHLGMDQTIKVKGG